MKQSIAFNGTCLFFLYHPAMEKRKVFDQILSKDLVDEETLLKLSNTGIPHEFRPIVYKILFGVLTRNTSLHEIQKRNFIRRYEGYFEKMKENTIDNKYESIKSKNRGNSFNDSSNIKSDKNSQNYSSFSDSPNIKSGKDSQNYSSFNDQREVEDSVNDKSKIDSSENWKKYEFCISEEIDSLNCIVDNDKKDRISNDQIGLTANISNSNKLENDSLTGLSLKSNILTKDNQDDTSNINIRKLNFILSSKVEAQIAIDINRISIEHRVINGVDYSYIYSNILIITAAIRPLTEYIQGMADIVVPFLHLFIENKTVNLFEIECSIFQCFQKILNKIEMNIQFLYSSSFNEIDLILRAFDPEISNYLVTNEIDLSMFGSKWLHCIFVREFSLENWYRVFDSMISTNLNEFLIFFTVALIRFIRTEILSLDGCKSIILLQNIKNINFHSGEIETLIGEVSYMRKIYQMRV